MWSSLKNKLGFKTRPMQEALDAQRLAAANNKKALDKQLLIAASNGDVPAIARAIRNGATFRARGALGRNALDMAAGNGHIDAINKLLEHGIDIDARDENQRTALHWASLGNRAQAIKTLLEAGAGVNLQSQWQQTPLHMALMAPYNADDITTIKLLLAAGTDLIPRDHIGYTPADDARLRGHTKLADYLQSIADGGLPRPTPEEAGLDIDKRIRALEKSGRPLGQFTEAEQRRQRQRETREAQRQEALRGGGI